MPVNPMGKSVAFYTAGPAAADCIAYVLIALLGLQIIFSVRNKAERATYLFILAEIPALHAGQASDIITCLSFASGCAAAAYMPPPIWVWRTLGNKTSVVIGAIFGVGVALILFSILPPGDWAVTILYYLAAATALGIFIAGDQFPESKLYGWLCLGLTAAIIIAILGHKHPLLSICAAPIILRVLMDLFQYFKAKAEATRIKDEHIILQDPELKAGPSTVGKD